MSLTLPVVAWVVFLSLLRIGGQAPSTPLTDSIEVKAARTAGEGTAVVIPDRVSVNVWTSIQVAYTVGSDGIAQGGGVQVQFSKSWHPWTPAAAAPQTVDPSAPYYVTAQTSRSGTSVGISVANAAIDGRTDRMDWTATLTITGDALVAGDLITYTFGDQSGGGAGFRSTWTALEEPVRIAVDADADGSFVALSPPPTLTLSAGPPWRLAVYGPSRAVAGIPFRLTVDAQDGVTNPAGTYAGTVSFDSTDPQAELPDPYAFAPGDGWHTFIVTLHSTGTQWITVTDNIVAPHGQLSNPIDCLADTSSLNIYWGDLHSHTEFSKDAYGPLAQALLRMRDQLGLDFYAVTDHVDYPTTGLMPDEWMDTRNLVEAWYQPGRFVPILGYEWSRPSPFGHHNVYFAGNDGPLCYLDECIRLTDLWQRLEGLDALTIPHHTGIRWATSEAAVDWSYNDPAFRTSIEIFSAHGQSEMYDPANPLSYESLHPGSAWSVNGPHYARDAWAAGHRVGVVAGSDEHTLRPGMPWNGLTAIYASPLDRPTLFDAIRARHTYATTGERILLDFRLGEAMMGDVVQLSPSEAPNLDVHVVGTRPLDWVELVRFDGLSYMTVYTATPGVAGDPREAQFRFTDSALSGNGLYYVRVRQPDPIKPDRPAMAWSSPIWVERKTLTYLPLVSRGGGSP